MYFLVTCLEIFIKQFGEKNRHLAVKDKNDSTTAQVAWFVSNCGSQSGREYFVKKLKRSGLMPLVPSIFKISSLCLVTSTSIPMAIAVIYAACIRVMYLV